MEHNADVGQFCGAGDLQVGAQLRQAVSALESAKSDNLALVERLRYVQGFKAQARGKGRHPN